MTEPTSGAVPSVVDVVSATAHPDTRRIDLDDRTVLRTPDRPDLVDGNLVVLADTVDVAALAGALADARRRLADPRTTPRLLAPVVDPPPTDGRLLSVVTLPADADTSPIRDDLQLVVPRDDRAWHGITVLQRHAVTDEDEAGARARGGRDDELRWWVAGRRRQRDQGRARVLVAMRFGVPVATGTLVWVPGAPVDAGHAGLAVVTDVVVHPAHRGLGIGTSVVTGLVATHRADFPRALVAAVVPGGGRAVLERAGWRARATVVDVREPDAAAGRDRTGRR